MLRLAKKRERENGVVVGYPNSVTIFPLARRSQVAGNVAVAAYPRRRDGPAHGLQRKSSSDAFYLSRDVLSALPYFPASLTETRPAADRQWLVVGQQANGPYFKPLERIRSVRNGASF